MKDFLLKFSALSAVQRKPIPRDSQNTPAVFLVISVTADQVRSNFQWCLRQPIDSMVLIEQRFVWLPVLRVAEYITDIVNNTFPL